MTREEIIRLAFQSRLTEDLWLTDETDYPHLERFAELVAAEYKQDALRYRWLRDMHDSGDPNWFVYAANPEEPLNVAIDAAMEKVK